MSESRFDLEAFERVFESRSKAGTDKRQDMIFMARTAEAAERYDDMCKFMKALVTWAGNEKQQLSVDERNLLSVAYKNVIGARRASWRTLAAEDEMKNGEDKLLKEYKEQLEKEIQNVCQELLDLLTGTLIKNADNSSDDESEAKVFYLKMAGDYYRYLAECIPEKSNEDSAADFYKQAFEIAEKSLAPTHPIRLGLALNYSVCYYEILKDQNKACELARNAFDSAISKLDKLAEPDYKDSTLIMQLLRDNLTLWTSTDEPEDEDQ